MAKPEIEFAPTSSVEFTPCKPHVEGLSEAVLARDDSNHTVTRILKFEPGTDTSPNLMLTREQQMSGRWRRAPLPFNERT